jgi:hypothetical protein
MSHLIKASTRPLMSNEAERTICTALTVRPENMMSGSRDQEVPAQQNLFHTVLRPKPSMLRTKVSSSKHRHRGARLAQLAPGKRGAGSSNMQETMILVLNSIGLSKMEQHNSSDYDNLMFSSPLVTQCRRVHQLSVFPSDRFHATCRKNSLRYSNWSKLGIVYCAVFSSRVSTH